MTEEFGWMLFLALTAIAIVVLNDWWKRSLIRKAERSGTSASDHWYSNRTNWWRVGLLIIGFTCFAIVRSNPQWTNNYSGPGEVLVHRFFPVR